MNKPNLFDFATSELSQDAFLCWLLSWADRQYRATDEALHKTAIALMNSLLSLQKIDALPECESLKVRRQYEDIDILVLVNGDIALLIEDKIDTSEHSGQLLRYLKIVREDFPGRRAIPVYLKSGDQSSLKAVEDAGWKYFGRSDLLAVLEHGERLGVRSDIYADFQSRLRRIEDAVQDYRRHPVQDWGHDDSRWTGFFVALQAQLGEGNWGKVAFPGNFMGFWWHGNGNKYLLLKEDQLCFKIHVPEKADQVAAWQAWHDVLMAESRSSGLALQRPARRGRGKNMTVAVLDNYLQVDGAGVVDVDRTVSQLRRAEYLMDAAVASTTQPASPPLISDDLWLGFKVLYRLDPKLSASEQHEVGRSFITQAIEGNGLFYHGGGRDYAQGFANAEHPTSATEDQRQAVANWLRGNPGVVESDIGPLEVEPD